jgi:hypothetical protein
MTCSSNNILQNGSNETSEVSFPVSTNMIIGSPTVPIQDVSSNVSLDGFQQVENKNKKKANVNLRHLKGVSAGVEPPALQHLSTCSAPQHLSSTSALGQHLLSTCQALF